jgi:hypothetical protein
MCVRVDQQRAMRWTQHRFQKVRKGRGLERQWYIITAIESIQNHQVIKWCAAITITTTITITSTIIYHREACKKCFSIVGKNA